MDGNVRSFHLGAAYKYVEPGKRVSAIYFEIEHEGRPLYLYFNESESLELISGIRKARAQAHEYLMTPEEKARAEETARMIREAQESNEEEYRKAEEIVGRIFDATKSACKLLEKDGHRAVAVALRHAIKEFFGEGITR